MSPAAICRPAAVALREAGERVAEPRARQHEAVDESARGPPRRCGRSSRRRRGARAGRVRHATRRGRSSSQASAAAPLSARSPCGSGAAGIAAASTRSGAAVAASLKSVVNAVVPAAYVASRVGPGGAHDDRPESVRRTVGARSVDVEGRAERRRPGGEDVGGGRRERSRARERRPRRPAAGASRRSPRRSGRRRARTGRRPRARPGRRARAGSPAARCPVLAGEHPPRVDARDEVVVELLPGDDRVAELVRRDPAGGSADSASAGRRSALRLIGVPKPDPQLAGVAREPILAEHVPGRRRRRLGVGDHPVDDVGLATRGHARSTGRSRAPSRRR